MSKPKKKIELGKSLEGYEAAGNPISSKFIDPQWGQIDFRNMSAKQADLLIAAGCPFLKKKGTAKSGSK